MIYAQEHVDRFCDEYLMALLWIAPDNDGRDTDNPFDDLLVSDGNAVIDLEPNAWECLDGQSTAAIRGDCADFVAKHGALMRDSGLDIEQCAHDFALTRNGHGTGFWDRGLGKIGVELADACASYGEQNLYSGDNGEVYCG